LFDDDDLGRPKLEAFERAIQRRAPELTIETIHGRATPDTVVELVRRSAIVIDASDNFPTRFLVADACALAEVPVVHAAAIRTRATVLTAPRGGRPCYRCLFEDLPSGDAPDCASAGVVGPVCGVAGAIAADAAVRYLRGEADVLGRITTYDGLTDALRSSTLRARPDCPLCGADRAITSIVFDRYASVTCEA
jgi:adenylyltransferase/sulfurtransferase